MQYDIKDVAARLLKNLLPSHLIKKLNAVPLTAFEWDDVDITDYRILANAYSIYEQFSPEVVEYEKEQGLSGMKAMQAFILSIYHLGVQDGLRMSEKDRPPVLEGEELEAQLRENIRILKERGIL